MRLGRLYCCWTQAPAPPPSAPPDNAGWAGVPTRHNGFQVKFWVPRAVTKTPLPRWEGRSGLLQGQWSVCEFNPRVKHGVRGSVSTAGKTVTTGSRVVLDVSFPRGYFTASGLFWGNATAFLLNCIVGYYTDHAVLLSSSLAKTDTLGQLRLLTKTNCKPTALFSTSL